MVDEMADGREAGLDRVFHALSDASRRRIVAIPREPGPLRVTDVAAAFEMSLNGVSKHLKVLEAAELVRREVRGREHWLSVVPAAFEDARAWLDVHRHFWGERLDALGKTLG